MSERISGNNQIESSPEVKGLLGNLSKLELVTSVPSHMQPLLEHLKATITGTMEEIISSGRNIFIAGPDWCRESSKQAGQAHAKVIIATYGQTYALPNKNPEVNKKMLESGNLDMFLMFDQNTDEPVGTACLVLDHDGWGELGRAASLGHVGNRLIQDLRILRWLTDVELSKRAHSLFATLRTAPDRNIGTQERPEIMRGGQAVCHIWADTPGVMIAGFGPLYKKHHALEQFARMIITKKDMFVADAIWISDEINASFVSVWLQQNGWGNDLPEINIKEENNLGLNNIRVTADIPPPELGITEFVHGDLHFDPSGVPLSEAIGLLETSGVPFSQFPVPINIDTRHLQKELMEQGFQAFQFTPTLENIQPATLWFGKVMGKVPVVPTFWQEDPTQSNPFWQGKLADHAERISWGWNKLPVNP